MADTTAKKKTAKKTSKKATTKGKRKIEKRDMKKSFWFPLTATEKKHHADEMVRVMTEKGKKELQFSDVKKKWQNEIKELETQIDDHRQIYNAGKEWREVACIEVKDFQKLEVRYMIGKKCMESREMDDKEKQMALSIKGKPVDSGKKTDTTEETKTAKDQEINDVMKEETSKSTKKSAVDSMNGAANSSAYQELHGGGAQA